MFGWREHSPAFRTISSAVRVCGLAAAIAAFSAPALGQETQTFKYDALGRLEEVSKTRVSTPAAPPTKSTIQYDAAGNRTNYATTGAPTFSKKVVVVPLLGFLVIPIS